MASVFLHHVVGDLTVAKPEYVEFQETETVESAIRAIGESTESGIPVWRRRSQKGRVENSEMRQQRFMGILNTLDIVAFLARDSCLEDQESAMSTPVSEIVVPNNSLLKEVDPATRLIDALDMMKHGVKRLLVRKSVQWKGVSKKFSIMYNGKWLKSINTNNSANGNVANTSQPSSLSSSSPAKFCCLSREGVIRFIIGCLGALAPIPLSSIFVLGAINRSYSFIEASLPAIEAIQKLPHDPSAVAVVELTPGGEHKIVGEILACKLWRRDYLAAAYALVNLSAGQFVMGVEDNVLFTRSESEKEVKSSAGNKSTGSSGVSSTRLRRFSGRNIGFFSNAVSPNLGSSRTSYWGRSAPLTCKATSSLAAVMAQMLSHRATHVWVTEDDEDVLVGVVGYGNILEAVTRDPSTISSS